MVGQQLDHVPHLQSGGDPANPPPYASPPAGGRPGLRKSYGASYYDASYVPADGDGRGAMMEHYEKRCLPIFPGSNQYSCSFVSLGNKAYFLRYADQPRARRSAASSPDNHPPRRDFIKHLPYNAEQSTHLNGSVQAYSRIVQPGSILFGYAFYKQPTRDGGKGAPYRHSQSFFSPAIPARRRTRPWSARTTATSARKSRTRNGPGSKWPKCARQAGMVLPVRHRLPGQGQGGRRRPTRPMPSRPELGHPAAVKESP